MNTHDFENLAESIEARLSSPGSILPANGALEQWRRTGLEWQPSSSRWGALACQIKADLNPENSAGPLDRAFVYQVKQNVFHRLNEQADNMEPAAPMERGDLQELIRCAANEISSNPE